MDVGKPKNCDIDVSSVQCTRLMTRSTDIHCMTHFPHRNLYELEKTHVIFHLTQKVVYYAPRGRQATLSTSVSF